MMMDHHIEAATLDDFGGNEVKKNRQTFGYFRVICREAQNIFLSFFTIDYRSSWQ